MLTYLHLLGEYLLFFMSTCWKWWFPPHWSRPGRCCHICCCSSCRLFQSRSKWICNKKGSGQVLRRNRDLKQREVVSQSCSRSQFTFLNCGWFSKSLSLPYFKTNLQMLFSCKEKKKSSFPFQILRLVVTIILLMIYSPVYWTILQNETILFWVTQTVPGMCELCVWLQVVMSRNSSSRRRSTTGVTPHRLWASIVVRISGNIVSSIRPNWLCKTKKVHCRLLVRKSLSLLKPAYKPALLFLSFNPSVLQCWEVTKHTDTELHTVDLGGVHTPGKLPSFLWRSK